MEEIRKLVKDKELIVRKRVVSFVEKLMYYLGHEFNHEQMKAVLYGKEGISQQAEKEAKNYLDGFAYLIINKENFISSALIKKAIYIITQEEISNDVAKKIEAKHFYTKDKNVLKNIIEITFYVYEILKQYSTKQRVALSLIFYNFLLLKEKIPCVRFLLVELKQIEQIIKENKKEDLYRFMYNHLLNSKYQDKSYYKNLKEISRQRIIKTILKEKDVLIKEYEVKSIYLYGSFSKNSQRIDSDIDLAIRFNLDLTTKENEENIKKLANFLFEKFHRYIDIYELKDILKEKFVEEANDIIKII